MELPIPVAFGHGCAVQLEPLKVRLDKPCRKFLAYEDDRERFDQVFVGGIVQHIFDGVDHRRMD